MKKSQSYILLVVIVLLAIILFPNWAFAYNPITHRDISLRSIDHIRPFLDNYLKTNLGLSLGTGLADLNTGQIREPLSWITIGSVFEDGESVLDIARPRQHFHNPITNVGLSDKFSGSSSVIWAINDSGNQWSWEKARNYYYQALTSPTDSGRNDRFAKTFRALGQVIHLIQDATVPEHVRNDAHVISLLIPPDSFAYESWISQNISPRSFTATPFLFPPNFQLRTFWDTDLYVDSASQQGPFIGLTEYTSYNFFSEDTIFTENEPKNNKHYFPHPSKDLTNAILIEELAEDGEIDRVAYVSGYKTNRLAAFSFMDTYLPPLILTQAWRYNLDPNVYNEYASILVPKAIRYSAGLLDYFFRGQLRVFGTRLGLVIQNASGEVMSFYDDPDTGEQIGSIEIHYDKVSGQRQLLATYDLPGPLDPNQATPVISFLPPGDNLVPDQYMVVFRGKLGAEEGAVIGQIFQRGIYYVGKEKEFQKIYRINLDGSNRTLILDNDQPDLTFGKLSLSPTNPILAYTTDFPTSLPAIYLLDLVGGPATFLTIGDWPDWSPDGSLIALQKDTGRAAPFLDNEIYTINPVTGVESLLTNSDYARGALNLGHPNWSPDGASLAVRDELFAGVKEDDCWNQFVIIVIPASGGLTTGTRSCSQRPLAMDEFPVHDGAATWRPDETELAFTRQRHLIDPPPLGTFLGDELYKMQIGTMDGQTKLTDSTGLDYKELTPDWSPDGGSIAIGSNRDGDFDIWLVDPNGGGYIENLTDSNPETDGFPAFGWAPE